MALPPKLEKELNELRHLYQISISEEGDCINVILSAFSLGEGFNVTSSDLLLRVPRSYPDAGPDMFWVDIGVTLQSGQPPQAAEAIEQHVNRRWRRFSWHHQKWNPSIDNLHGYLEFVRRRLREKR